MPDNHELECIEDANTVLQDLLRESCALPLSQLRDLATDHGIDPMSLLNRAVASENCRFDFDAGIVRCVSEPVPALSEGGETDGYPGQG